MDKSCIKKGCGEETVARDFVIKLDTEKEPYQAGRASDRGHISLLQ